MAIPNISSATYQTPIFLEATKSSGKNYGYVDEKPYHQASAAGMNLFAQRTTKASTQDPRGALWAGFDTSQYDVNKPNSRSETLGCNLYTLS